MMSELPSHAELLQTLEERFKKYPYRHASLSWEHIEKRLKAHPEVLTTLAQMETTGGEPDVISYDAEKDRYLFVDCAPESPQGRRSLCYDEQAWMSRKANKPQGNALSLLESMGAEILNESEYEYLQSLENCDTKTSSWIETPPEVRALGGALFCDRRYGRVFTYHNGAESYYAARGVRAKVEV